MNDIELELLAKFKPNVCKMFLYCWKISIIFLKMNKIGATTHSITTLSMMTLCIMTLSIMTLSIMTLSIKTFSITKN
jgi:hypothetical protein